MSLIRLFIFAHVFLVWCLLGSATEESPDKTLRIDRLWMKKVSVESEEIPLRTFLDRLGSSSDFAYFIDRRLDPEQTIRCSLDHQPLLEGLLSIAKENRLEIYPIDMNLYVGPIGSSGELDLLLTQARQQLDALPESLRSRFLRRANFSSTFAALPESLLKKAVLSTRFSWSKDTEFPFDRWNELKLRPLTLTDLLTVLLVGFDLRYELDPETRSLRLVPVTLSSKSRSAKSDQLQKQLEEKLRTPLEDERPTKRSSSKRSSTKGKKVLSGHLENNRLRELFPFIEKEFGLTIKLDPKTKDLGLSLDTRISCHFEEASQREVLDKIAHELDLQWKQKGRIVLFQK